MKYVEEFSLCQMEGVLRNAMGVLAVQKFLSTSSRYARSANDSRARGK